MVYVFREQGVVPSLVAVAGSLAHHFMVVYAQAENLQAPAIAMSNIGHEAAALLKLGVAFMASGLF